MNTTYNIYYIGNDHFTWFNAIKWHISSWKFSIKVGKNQKQLATTSSPRNLLSNFNGDCPTFSPQESFENYFYYFGTIKASQFTHQHYEEHDNLALLFAIPGSLIMLLLVSLPRISIANLNPVHSKVLTRFRV